MTKKGASAASLSSDALDNGVGVGRFVCSMCAKVYRSGAGLRYHKRKRHRGMVEPTALHRVKCQEPGCTYQMLAISDLRNHLANHHQKPEYKCTEEKKFTSVADFTDWKSTFESRTGSKYVKNCGAKGKSDNQTTEYYYCNRTGPYKTVGQGLRRSKAQGALRCGIHCTSSMKVEIQNDEHITVQYYPAHYGHSHLPASDEPYISENSMTIGGINGSSSSTTMMNAHHQQQQQQQENGHNLLSNYPSQSGDRSSSSSPGSSSTSPSGGSNSNSNHPTPSSSSSLLMSTERQSMTTSNSLIKNVNTTYNNHNSLQNHMSHCIIISPSFVLEENVSSHSNHHSTPVLFVQQQQQTNNHLSSTAAIVTPATNLAVKQEKCVSDIMREAFQLLSYWPLDHHHGLVTTENEQQIHHSHINMDEHLMF
ncbi:unnamed protein product [Rotaria magnacalcarata]|uniref:C2H2-type domain-containing protein n=2 Tax=Rotaria magnacalcarata TaxID=392030 RepID=A0A816CW13_9BILA|nr:unnamed protein product [Rotaria magnacalcarata]CAF1656075.1 unnamed protein product [Rotaria magnacalcarata]CAF3848680.1 unnamed protein product [Rotaria magnacalcarata]CAF3919217.1 unnamed protein product [Rotaria magnacalcarata]